MLASKDIANTHPVRVLIKRGHRRFWRKEGTGKDIGKDIGKGTGEMLRQSHTIGKKPIGAVKPPT
jgi:hypothetical protein